MTRLRRAWRSIRIVLVATAGLCVIGLVAIEVRHRIKFGNYVSYGMDVHVLRESGSYGIPGVGSVYAAQMYNYTFSPITLRGCQGPKDTSPYYEIIYRYEVQRWDLASGNWTKIMSIPPGQCPPEKVVSNKISPTQSLLVIDWEATAAREGFHKGDWARFRIFTLFNSEDGAPDQILFASPPFRIDEEVTNRSTTYRIKH